MLKFYDDGGAFKNASSGAVRGLSCRAVLRRDVRGPGPATPALCQDFRKAGLHGAIRKLAQGQGEAFRDGTQHSLPGPAGQVERAAKGEALPVQGDRVYWFATCNAPEDESDSEDGPQSHLLSLFEGWHEPIEDLIRVTADSTILRNDIYDCDPLGEWGRGRVTLLGDAAHPMTPNLGQGACQAIEDALELAAFLADERELEMGLEKYEKRRIARTGPIVLASRRH